MSAKDGNAIALDTESGLVSGAEYIPSPNQDDRPNDSEINLIVIHGISLPAGEFGGPWIDRLFANQLKDEPGFEDIADLRVSSHFLIRRGGELLQYVPVSQRAWHAGVSSFKGREACNDFSIGIELEGTDDIPYEEVQYDSLLDLVDELVQHYPAISLERIVGHEDIAPGRKTDPGPAFNWKDFRKKLKQRLASSA